MKMKKVPFKWTKINFRLFLWRIKDTFHNQKSKTKSKNINCSNNKSWRMMKCSTPSKSWRKRQQTYLLSLQWCLQRQKTLNWSQKGSRGLSIRRKGTSGTVVSNTYFQMQGAHQAWQNSRIYNKNELNP